MTLRLLMWACVSLTLTTSIEARVWTDTTGKYTIEADLIGFDDEQVILKRADKELGAFPLDKLSEKDREYLKSREAKDLHHANLNELQTWAMQSGLQVRGRIVDYARKDMTLQRRRGKIYVNDRVFENLPEIYRKMIPEIVAHFDELDPADARNFRVWMRKQRDEPRTFQLEGVVMELESGDEYGVPFFFFDEKELRVLKSGWDEWVAAHDDYETREDESFKVQSLAAAMHQDRQIDREIAITQLNMQAIAAGVTSAWEVTLYPAQGNPSAPRWVVVPGRNSREAQQAAVTQNPGFVPGPTRRISI